MRRRFDEQLKQLNHELIQMGALCETLIELAAKTVRSDEKELVEKIKPMANELDQMEHDVESLCLKLLLQQQPVASDLRRVSSALKMITDMERIGDQAEDIAEIVTIMKKLPDMQCDEINEMAKATIHMVNGSVDAFVKQDVGLAHKVIKEDDIVDEYFVKVRSVLIEKIAENPQVGENALDLLMIAKYFERIGDHVTNIAEWVVFSVTGIHKEEKTDENMVCRR